LGYVGQGMLDGCAIGDVFQSPSADQMPEVTRAISGGKSVLYVYGNYGGDVLNFDMATEMAGMEDIEVRTVLVKIADQIVQTIQADLLMGAGDRVAVMVNGAGTTPLEELYILYRRVHQIPESQKVSVHRAFVGEYATSLEMPGASITLMKLDDELTGLLDHPAHTPFFKI